MPPSITPSNPASVFVGDEDLSAFVKTSLVDLVTDRIRAAIFAGTYLPGRKLIVRELSEALGVSHTPVKDALNRLISEGLVEAFPNRSMVVRRFSNHELIENLAVRLMCELFFAPEIVRGAASDTGLIDDMEASLADMLTAIGNPVGIDYQGWVEAETRFHRRYMSVCENDSLIALYNGLDSNRFTYFAFLRNEKTPLSREILDVNLGEHRAIIAALAAGDSRAFQCAVVGHLVRACEDYAVDEASIARIRQIRRLAEAQLGDSVAIARGAKAD